jgi:glycosyltransferase involved in cell wall biosynthesis
MISDMGCRKLKKLSVLTTIYNGESFIDDMFNSIAAQTFTDFEWIIIEDGSTDGTWSKLQQCKDERIKLYQLPENRGVGLANEYALSLASGEYIAKVDADDISLPNRFEKQVQFLDDHPLIDMVDCFIEYFPHSLEDRETKRFQQLYNGHQAKINRNRTSEELSEDIYWNCLFINGAMMARRKSVKAIGYSSHLRQGEDYELFYKMNKANMKFYRIPETLINIRVSMSSTTSQNQNIIKDVVYQVKKEDMTAFFRDTTRPFVIWGAGQRGIDTHTFIQKEFGEQPIAFWDSNSKRVGELVDGILIAAPNHVNSYRICIASSYGQDEIIQYLKQYGCRPLEDYYVVI